MSSQLPVPLSWLLGSMVIILVAITIYMKNDSSGDLPLVDTDCGPLMGSIDKQYGVYMFKGVPFAAPPTGDRRWRPPVRMSRKDGTCWKGTYEALQYGPQCAQLDPWEHRFAGQEDCLYLNVYTPTLNTKARKPVIFYIHGGYIHFCNGSMRGYSPNPWVTQDLDVVFVSVQYRFAFYSFFNQLTLFSKRSAH